MTLQFATWNIRQSRGADSAKRKLDYLLDQEWDVVALQEVTHTAAEVFGQQIENWIWPAASSGHGVALASRHGVVLRAPALMAELPIAERGLWAVATFEGGAVEVGSLHVTNAVKSVADKRAHFVALTRWLAARPAGPRVLGMDANHAYDPRWPDLPGAVYQPRGDAWEQEFAFFSADATHGMCDAWLTCLSRDPDRLNTARSVVQSEPSAASFIQTGQPGRWPRKRLDYIFVSGLHVVDASYDPRARAGQLSDHSLHLASLAAVE